MKSRILAALIKTLGWDAIPSASFQHRRLARYQLLPAPLGSTVVDIGCGSGMLTIEMSARNPGTTFICLDRSRNDLYRGKALAEKLHLHNILWVEGDAGCLPLFPASIKLAMASYIVVDFGNSIFSAVSEWVGHIAPSGWLLIETPLASPTQYLFRIPLVRTLVKRYVDPCDGFPPEWLEAAYFNNKLGNIKAIEMFKGIGALARELHYLLMSIHPFLAEAFYAPLLLLMRTDRWFGGRGNAIVVIGRKGIRDVGT
ncbi:MAG: class I SAM-dependent methyltransferase [Candidatus Edwardsbacteria bacterium]|nr:class I SAM-dependent methyltransferase [Candidatus Edwardsbacteria bacterium]MBU2594213.1 class I SAM-dependent methyltransferase [Candidatus Edwardsbacteria bacterium]